MSRDSAVERIRQAAVRVAASHGLTLFDLQFRRESIGWVLRVTVDRPVSLAAVFAPLVLADNFETGALRANIGWATNNAAGIAPWFVQAASGLATNAPAGGGFHVRSGVITNSQTTFCVAWDWISSRP